MKLIPTSTLLLGSLLAKDGPSSDDNQVQLLRTSGTHNPEKSDFTKPIEANLDFLLGSDYINYPAGSTSQCTYLKSSPRENYNGPCTPYPWGVTSSHGVACEWRDMSADTTTIPSTSGTYNGWHCNNKNTVCMAVIYESMSWWEGHEACQSRLGVKMAAPKTNEEVELITAHFKPSTGRFYIAGFYEASDNKYYWAHDSPDFTAQNYPLLGPQWVYDKSAANAAFEQANFVEVADQSTPTEILEKMLSDAGLSTSQRRKRNTELSETTVDGISEMIKINGCWCPGILNDGDHFNGAPLNGYDYACRTLSQCTHRAKHCEGSGACFDENLDEGFEYAIDVSDLSKGYECRAMNGCDTAICMCQVQFAKDVFELVTANSNTMTIAEDELNLGVISGSTQCVVNVGGGVGGNGNGGQGMC